MWHIQGGSVDTTGTRVVGEGVLGVGLGVVVVPVVGPPIRGVAADSREVPHFPTDVAVLFAEPAHLFVVVGLSTTRA